MPRLFVGRGRRDPYQDGGAEQVGAQAQSSVGSVHRPSVAVKVPRAVRVEPVPAQCAGEALDLVQRQPGQVNCGFGGPRALCRFQGAAQVVGVSEGAAGWQEPVRSGGLVFALGGEDDVVGVA